MPSNPLTTKEDPMSRLTGAAAAVAILALALPAAALAHAAISPPVALAKHLQVFTLAVPTEEDNATTTTVEFTPPAGFTIDSFVPAAGWTRKVDETGSGENAVVTKVTWSGGKTPTGEDSAFQFLAQASAAKSYTFQVLQTYSDGKVVDWSGPESSDTPAPTLEAVSSIGGGGSSTLAIVALVVGALGLLLGVVGLAGGKRALG
jgi:uncharacterized protein YcnI